jgi:hypothetical protein
VTPPRATAAVVGAAAAGVGGWRLAVLAGHWGQPAYAMPLGVVVVAALALGAALVAAVVTVRAARPDVVLLGIVSAGLLAYGILGIFSIGLPLLLLGAAACTALVRRLGGASRSLRVAGPGLGVAVVAIVVLAAQLPVVECNPAGVTSSTPIWLFIGGASGSSGSGSSDSGLSTGTVTTGGASFAYRCAGDRMTDFRRL